ncbi:carboxypeptidase-like regulatory domain-containing protein [Lacinutrix sp. Bg11-31]|uniref:carboxypeptidase-like regulatory domain-containing protein n=1 Tax=Lacinutrix sp. Bg11-31 TaxID=2057808 RepID=UPI0012FD4899|nr:carboxypeptidase-like regulatory domain-containing protein [Lacinutrix sp. Bg11-31]
MVGIVNGEESVENIHVINRTQKKYATTNDKGEFNIEAIKNDTIVLTSIQYKSLTHIVTADNIKNKTLNINLETQVNELPEAVIGFTLTGDLSKDVLNSDAKRTIDFYDVGIPGYKGKRKTKSERLLAEAGEFEPSMLLGILGGSVPLNPILNAISGRTKELKKRVKLEANTKMMNALKNRLSEAFFKENELKEDFKSDFFYFCAEDETFKTRCASSDLEALKFMKEKYLIYKENLALKE